MKTDLSHLISDLLSVTLVPFDVPTYAGKHYGVHLFFMGNSTSRFPFSEQNLCINAKIQDIRSKAGEFEVFSLSNNKAYYNVYERYTKLSSMMENDREFRSRYTLTGTPGI